jgi:dihydroorotate dehydrogenase
MLMKEHTIPGKNKISSKSNRTNKIAKKKKGALTDILEFNLSNPDSKGVSLSLLEIIFKERKT